MTELSKKNLESIVNEFGNLTERAYSGKFNWEADVGNCMTPLGFAAHIATYSDDLPRGLITAAEEAATYLYNTYPHNMQDREFTDVVDDILRDIAFDAQEGLENLEPCQQFVYLSDPCSRELPDYEEYPVGTPEEIDTARDRMTELGIAETSVFCGLGADQYKTISKLYRK